MKMKLNRSNYPKNYDRNTKTQIINIAQELFAEFGYLGVSMNDIAKRLNITKTAIYYHFKNKAELYKKVMKGVFARLNLSINQSLKEETRNKKIHKLIKNYLDFGSKEKNVIKVLTLNLMPENKEIIKYIIQLKKKTIDLIQQVVNQSLENENIVKKSKSQVLGSMLTNIMDGLLLEYLFFNKKINTVNLSNQIINILF